MNETIRKTVFELFAKGDFPGLIFTYMCAFDMQSEFDYLQNVIDLFKSNDSNCYVVELCADFVNGKNRYYKYFKPSYNIII